MLQKEGMMGKEEGSLLTPSLVSPSRPVKEPLAHLYDDDAAASLGFDRAAWGLL